jgi:gamma-glutamyltranspeptidase
VVVEPYFSPEKVLALVALGHRVRLGSLFGSAHSIAVGPEILTGAADLRARGAGAAGY